jgi:hypothetical protein
MLEITVDKDKDCPSLRGEKPSRPKTTNKSARIAAPGLRDKAKTSLY